MNRATDEDARVMLEAFYKAQARQPKVDADFAEDVVEDFTAPMRAAAEALLSRRQVTREAIVATADAAESDWKHDAARGRAGGTLCDYIANAIADLFGVTD